MIHADPTFTDVAWAEHKALRKKYGCSACATREEAIKGGYLCRIEQTPGKKGYCWQWALDQLWVRT